jgi:hypothetical protein
MGSSNYPTMRRYFYSGDLTIYADFNSAAVLVRSIEVHDGIWWVRNIKKSCRKKIKSAVNSYFEAALEHKHNRLVREAHDEQQQVNSVNEVCDENFKF